MSKTEKLLEAAKMIQEHCKKTVTGELCPFGEDVTCMGPRHCKLGVGRDYPEEWDVPKPYSWTEADILLAKALSDFGVQEIKRNAGTVLCVTDGISSELLPFGCFSALADAETVRIDDIISKEGENQ